MGSGRKRVLVIGAGSIGTRHLRVIHGLGCDVMGCDTQPGAFDAIRRDIPALPAFADLGRALAERPDIVVVATPPALHEAHARSAFRAGAHVLCEKPMADTAAACGRMIRAARAARRVLHVGFVNRYHPVLQRLKRELNAGRLGTVLFGAADLGSYVTLTCSRSRYQATVYGALLMDYTHQLDFMPWLMGSPAVRVYAVGQKKGVFEHGSNPAMIAMILEHANGTITEIHLDYCRHPQQASVSLTGDRGYLQADLATNRIDRGLRHTGAVRRWTLTVERDDLFRAQFRQVVAAAEGRPASIVSGEEGREATRLAEAALRSLRLRRPVAVRLPVCAP